MEEAAPAVEGAPEAAAPKPQAAGGLTPLMLERSVKQIEFYFSDSNLPRDKFLLEKVHASPAGWVDLGLVATFERMRELLKARHWRCANLAHCCSACRLRATARSSLYRWGPLTPVCRRRLAPVSSPCSAAQITAPRIPPATIAALAQALRTSAPSLVGASLAHLPLATHLHKLLTAPPACPPPASERRRQVGAAHAAAGCGRGGDHQQGCGGAQPVRRPLPLRRHPGQCVCWPGCLLSLRLC
jgi:hypothetical protein